MFRVDPAVVIGKKDKDHLLNPVVRIEEIQSGFNGDTAGLLEGVSVHAAADGRESNRTRPVLGRKRKAVSVAAGQQLPVFRTAAVDGAHGVNHEAGRQPVPLGQTGLAGGAAPEGSAFGQQLRTGGPVNGPVNAATAQKGAVGRMPNPRGLSHR